MCLLKVDSVTKGYWRGASYIGVLSGVSLEVGSEEIVAVIGRRLGGKSTLLQIVAGLETPDSGSVALAGHPVRAHSGLGLRDLIRGRKRPGAPLIGRDIILVTRDGPQGGFEVSKFVGGPLAVHGGRRRSVQLAAAAALDRVGASACMGRRWGELSNYQRALVGLARAFAGAPQLVILDDLLDAHDRRDTEALSDLLHGLVEECARDCAVLLSVGDYESAVTLASRVCTLTPKGKLSHSSGRAISAAEREQAGNVVQLRRSVEGRGDGAVGNDA